MTTGLRALLLGLALLLAPALAAQAQPAGDPAPLVEHALTGSVQAHTYHSQEKNTWLLRKFFLTPKLANVLP